MHCIFQIFFLQPEPSTLSYGIDQQVDHKKALGSVLELGTIVDVIQVIGVNMTSGTVRIQLFCNKLAYIWKVLQGTFFNHSIDFYHSLMMAVEKKMLHL